MARLGAEDAEVEEMPSHPGSPSSLSMELRVEEGGIVVEPAVAWFLM
jgi:hypothetical protein